MNPLGMWLSWLARFAHIEEVGGSSPSIPTIASIDNGFGIDARFILLIF